MPQFDISTYYSQIFWLIIIFGGLYFVISKFIAPRAEKIRNDRHLTIKSYVNIAEELSSKSKELNERYNKEIHHTLQTLELLRNKKMSDLELNFLEKKKSLTKSLKEQVSTNIEEINIAKKLFWLNEDKGSIELASAVIKKITTKQADLKLLNQCYEKIRGTNYSN